MKTYTIYHIPGIKIGCTDNLDKRLKAQKFENCEILETHTDVYLASEREQYLQKEYGLPIDSCPYWRTAKLIDQNWENHREVMSKGQSIGGKKRMTEAKKHSLKESAKKVWLDPARRSEIRKKISENATKRWANDKEGMLVILAKARKASANKIRVCPRCGCTGNGPTMFRYHFQNCKRVL